MKTKGAKTEHSGRGMAGFPLLLVILGVILLLFIVLFAVRHNRQRKAKEEADRAVAAGIAVLESLEAQDPADVRAILSQNEQAAVQAVSAEQAEDVMAKIESGEVDLWSCFDDIVLFGDSRVDDFVADGFLPREKVHSKIGVNVRSALDPLAEVTAQNPGILIFTYGFNDADGNWNSSQAFIDAYSEVLRTYHEALPDAMICACSIMPVLQKAIDKDANLVVIPEYNEKIREMCSTGGYVFIDCEELGEEVDLYDADGIHYLPSFYPIWAKVMLRAVYQEQAAPGSGPVSAQEIAPEGTVPAEGTP